MIVDYTTQVAEIDGQDWKCYGTKYDFKKKAVVLLCESAGAARTIPAKQFKYGWQGENLSESALQQRIVMHHWNSYPNERGLLFHTNNNAASARQGAILKGMGVVAGVADLTFVWNDRAHFLELKLPGGIQSAVQKQWQAAVEAQGCAYYIIRSVADFSAVRGEIIAKK